MPLAAMATVAGTGPEEGGTYLDTVINAAKTIATQSDLNEIGRAISIYSTMEGGGGMPDEATFNTWLEKNIRCGGKSCGEDHFGNPYRLKRDGKIYYIYSNGPDGEPNTEDDIEVKFEAYM